MNAQPTAEAIADLYPSFDFNPEDRHAPWPMPEPRNYAEAMKEPKERSWGEVFAGMAERVGLS